jgi:hypothetical protein
VRLESRSFAVRARAELGGEKLLSTTDRAHRRREALEQKSFGLLCHFLSLNFRESHESLLGSRCLSNITLFR